MGIFSTAEWLASIDRSSVVYQPENCLHSHSRSSECDACFELCPAKAIQPGKPPLFDANACQTCLACLPVCPTGAFRADDSVQDLLLCATRLESKEIELLCTLHPAPEAGLSSALEAIQVRGCLAGLGSGAYLALAALQVKGIGVRVDACSDCPWGKLEAQVRKQVESAAYLLSALMQDVALQLLDDQPPLGKHNRPLWKAANPPLSRRDLFRMAAQRSQTAAARALNANKTDQTGPHPGRDRRRINEALDRIGLIEARQPVDMGCFGYAGLSVAETCTACGVCGRACPSGALTFTQNKGLRFELNFEARNCIGCEICSQVCAPQAISVDHHPGYQVIFSKEPIQILHQGRLVNCERCNTLFASETDIKLCPLCRVRRESPFGTQLPESLKHIQECIDKRKAA